MAGDQTIGRRGERPQLLPRLFTDEQVHRQRCVEKLQRRDGVLQAMHFALTVEDQTRLKITKRSDTDLSMKMVVWQCMNKRTRRFEAIYESHAPESQQCAEDGSHTCYTADQSAAVTSANIPDPCRCTEEKYTA